MVTHFSRDLFIKKIFGVHAGLGINLTGLGVRGFRTPPGRRPPGLMDHINAPTTSDLEKYTFRYEMEKKLKKTLFFYRFFLKKTFTFKKISHFFAGFAF